MDTQKSLTLQLAALAALATVILLCVAGYKLEEVAELRQQQKEEAAKAAMLEDFNKHVNHIKNDLTFDEIAGTLKFPTTVKQTGRTVTFKGVSIQDSTLCVTIDYIGYAGYQYAPENTEDIDFNPYGKKYEKDVCCGKLLDIFFSTYGTDMTDFAAFNNMPIVFRAPEYVTVKGEAKPFEVSMTASSLACRYPTECLDRFRQSEDDGQPYYDWYVATYGEQ